MKCTSDLHLLLTVSLIFSFRSSHVYSYSKSLLLSNEKICQSIDIRKRSQLYQLSNCTVIEGDLYIIMVTLPTEHKFPLLKEITGSLVISYVHGIKSLEAYFPNLVVIRGQTLVYNYALIIKGSYLSNIGLVSLRTILVGGVRIDNNPPLCYISTINWQSIIRQTGAPIKIINTRHTCPDFCPKNCSQSSNLPKLSQEHCWSHKTCQTICSLQCTSNNLFCHMDDKNRCCHPECLGGCYGEGDDKCVACKNVMSGGRCVKNCKRSYYKYKDRRCISKLECSKLSSQSSTDYRRKALYAIEDDSCVKQCSSGKQRDEVSGHCVVCGDNCSKKYCRKALIHSINDLTAVNGCYSIEAISISIKEGGSSLSEMLENSFSKLTVIENSLKIYGSSSITSLNFLKSLRLIKGNSAKSRRINDNSDTLNKSVVFEVYDNENLFEIFNEKVNEEQLNITILYGSVSFNLNRQLCPEKILKFLKTNVHSQTKLSILDEKIINITNGDMAFCKHETINVFVKSVSDSSFVVECKSKISDVLLQDSGSAALFMVKETQRNISQFELFSSCSDQNWRTTEGSLGKPFTIDGLQPAKRYAFYVEAFCSRVENWLVISDVIYITTKRKHPSPPVNLKTETLSYNEIRLSWSPPLSPNGIVTKYFIWFKSFDVLHVDFLFDNFCPYESYSQIRRAHKDTKTANDAVSRNTKSNHLVYDCVDCMTYCNQNSVKRSIDRDYFDPQLLDQYISQSFQKQESIPNSNWFPRNGDIDLKNINFNETSSNEESNVSDLPPRTEIQNNSLIYNSSFQPMTVVQVPADIHFFIFTNLHHYTEYLFEIQACQDPMPDGISLTYQKDYSTEEAVQMLKSICSLKSSISANTFPKDHMDDINDTTVSSNVMGNTVHINWTEPKTPNGLILNFFLRYRDVPCENTDNWLETVCITRLEWLNDRAIAPNETANSSLPRIKIMFSKKPQSGSFFLRNLRPGKYEFQIKSISIPGNGSWTKSFYFNVPQNSVFKMYRSLFLVGSVMAILIIILTIWLGYYYYRKRYLAKTKWVSSNPDYWIIYEIDEWEIDRKDVDMIEWSYPLGRGSFGMVYKGILINLTTPVRHQFHDPSELKNMFVAVKTLNANSTILERREFINEACYMKQFQSYHLVKLFGVVSKISHSQINKRLFSKKFRCSRFSFMERVRHFGKWKFPNKLKVFKSSASNDKDLLANKLEDLPSAQMVSIKTTISQHFQKMPLVIMELMDYGDLAGYLRKQGEEGEGVISENQSYLWALQISDGMMYLSEMKFVHRDLAARNCMINSSLIIKIGDFGMARDIYYDCYYRKEGKERLPVRWMAPESLQSAYFTTNSDVWSYGVVLWEIFTLASLPYRGMSHQDVIQFVTNGGTLLSNGAFTCPKLLLEVVESCWLYNFDDRPTFYDICYKLEKHSDENFQINSYYFRQKYLNDQKQETDSLENQLDQKYSADNLIHQ